MNDPKYVKPNGLLCRIAMKHGTDKATHNRTDKLCYLDIYESYFKKFQHKKINILEIGIREGSSIDTWEEYFPNANIFGVDIEERCKKHERDRVKITIGDATEKSTIDAINPENFKYDIIIDDGSHKNEDIEKSFRLLWDKVSPQGMYIIEDLYNTYGSTDRDILKDSSGISTNKREDISVFFSSIIRDVDTPSKNKLAVHFWDSICVIIKSKNT